MEESVGKGHDAGGVLTAVLQYRERVVDRLVHPGLADDAYQSAHAYSLLLPIRPVTPDISAIVDPG